MVICIHSVVLVPLVPTLGAGIEQGGCLVGRPRLSLFKVRLPIRTFGTLNVANRQLLEVLALLNDGNGLLFFVDCPVGDGLVERIVVTTGVTREPVVVHGFLD